MRATFQISFIFFMAIVLFSFESLSAQHCSGWQGNFRLTLQNPNNGNVYSVQSTCLMHTYIRVQPFLIRREDTGSISQLKYSQIKAIEIANPNQIKKDNAFQNYREGAYSTKAIVTVETPTGLRVIKGDIRCDNWWKYRDDLGGESFFYLARMGKGYKYEGSAILVKLEVLG